MTFGNPSRSAGAAGDGSLEPLLFGFSSKPRGTRVDEEEEDEDEEEYRGAGCPRLQPQRRQGKRREEEERRESAMIKTREETSLTFGTLASISTEKIIEPHKRIKL